MSDENVPPPPAEFALFCYSLASQAMSFLGLAPNPVSGETEKNLDQAKYSIDILEMLKLKTEGNLSDEETKVLMSLLFDLRMRYVEASKKK